MKFSAKELADALIVEKYVAKMDALEGDDTESDHASADDYLIKVLEDLGLAELSSAWQRVHNRCHGFWYA